MKYNPQISFDDVVNADPTLKYLIRDNQFNFDLLEHQVNIRGAAVVSAISKWIDLRIRIESATIFNKERN